ncbi:hypothetical protein A3A49_00200 [Candidatus Curtissbacteria bacterium RIFCSPLOWO2_01_FULL_38_11b]|uniref:Transglutaminase-like domain-containing protein n=1 Tax=Candidatus Curtissbacteria bacterium RIFCSPLOWO2_01_FULL_38_11b TaxID=1797725 RepID=A0A1F5H3M7_9BACT|nr:MAG: hypothetical protein A3A49_00200 [Candidatus Curtissbacteria bacterium RIFCSPLOWO2_01_FULL_38_11b]
MQILAVLDEPRSKRDTIPMRFAARLLLSLVFLFSFFLTTHHSPLITRDVLAEGEFETNYHVIYTVDDKALTTVTQSIELINKTPNFYADKFELKIGSAKVLNVSAFDNTGPLKTDVKFENNLTSIKIEFNQKVIGTGKNLNWTLIYSSEELASKSGQIWEISIPRLAKSANIGKYEAIVTVPRNFGPQAFAIPEPSNKEINPTVQKFTFNKDQLLESGIAMSFGEKQVFSYKLNYYLENNNVTSQIQEITLPPDNNYQKIILEKLEPVPLDVIVDEDGNFKAVYKLAPKQKLDITAEGFVEVFYKPFRNVYKKLSDEEKRIYLQPQRYWETDNGFIKDKANELKNPQKIYDFVSTFLSYNQKKLESSQIERKGAASAANSPNDSVCMEFTDLFIAIARAAQIPAREVTGYAYTQNTRLRPLSLALNEGDILHAWPEYWDDETGWIQIDPTWSSTSGGLDYFSKLDFNHITFSQRGKSSTSPQSAGAYKKQGRESEKSVFVEFAQNLPKATVNPQLSLMSPNKIISGIPTKIQANLKNSGSATIYDQKITLATGFLKSLNNLEYNISTLPPFASRTYDFRLQSTQLMLSASDTLVLSFLDIQTIKPITIEPFYRLLFSPLFLFSISILFFIIIIGLISYKMVFRRK